MRNLLAIAAAVAINVALFAALERSADEALPVPNGEVIVTELDLDSVPTLAHASTGKSDRATL